MTLGYNDKRDFGIANTPFREKDNHNPSAQNIEIIEWVQLKGNQNHFQKTGCGLTWLERTVWARKTVSSNLTTPTECGLTGSPVTIDASID